MKALLLFRSRDFDPDAPQIPLSDALRQDLELESIFSAMADGDKTVDDVVRTVLLQNCLNVDEITYRQAILNDCMRHPDSVRALYDTVDAALTDITKYGGWSVLYSFPDSILAMASARLKLAVEHLGNLRRFAETHAADFSSEGFRTLFSMFEKELDDEYLTAMRSHLAQLDFPDGMLAEAQLGNGLQSSGWRLLCRETRKRSLWSKLGGKLHHIRNTSGFEVPHGDESGTKAVYAIKDKIINETANAAAQSTEHILSFLEALKKELAFYIGCLNLASRLQALSLPVCMPIVCPTGMQRHTASALYSVSLALRSNEPPVSNDFEADGKQLVVVTGANQGGKTTFLRSIGQAQLMMQCGMFVGAAAFCANVCSGLFTHFKREEDASMKSGKLDEELTRMSGIVGHLKAGAMVLFSESFSSTNEREGSEICRQITTALLENQVTIFTVTYLYQFASDMYDLHDGAHLFLQAGRDANGTRSFRILPGAPVCTGFGQDLFSSIFKDK